MTDLSQRGIDGAGSSTSAGKPVDENARVVGEQLAAARMQKGRSVDEMAARLKVPVAKLAGLEAGDLSVLPDVTFAIGLVRSYAKILQIDPAPLVTALKRSGGLSPDFSLPEPAASTGLRRAHVPLTWSTRRTDRRSWLIGGVAVVAVLVALVVWRLANEPNGWLARWQGSGKATGTTATTQLGGSDTVTTALPTSGVMGTGGTGATGATGATVGTDGTGTAGATDNPAVAPGATVSPTPGAPTVLPASPVRPPEASGAAATPQQSGAVTPASLTANASGVSGANVVVDVRQDSWISVRQKGGKEVFSGTVRPGSPQNLQAVRPIQIVVGNVAGLNSLTVDGQTIDLQRYTKGRSQVARVDLP
ncbi:helix-turn-helix domain-containing protein [Chitinasiproducens palmae]|uniref:Cytoskeleton protein RodZ n=1 Tax=Chitinasiproducens palmae TaxID=1770053 RepID=A0A1H2PVV1_9BURK|nr:helix-turn-helix domain-containing protein [Chitinasiproducens palmae]SDV51419.1 cytoskeleton protein RodZ [Chitinasiproducens palmae]